MFCETEPVIESSGNLTFAPYNVSYPQQDKHLTAVEFNTEENKWDMIFDFTDTNESGEKETHHKLMDPSEFSKVEKQVEGFEDPLTNPFPIPQRYGGTGADNDLTKKEEDGTFDIRTTSKEDAEKIYEEHQKQQEQQEEPKDADPQLQEEGFGAGQDSKIYFEEKLKIYQSKETLDFRLKTENFRNPLVKLEEILS